LTAYGEQIVRAYHSDFGPAEAAARYVGDKAFEALTVIFSMRIWYDYLLRSRRAKELPTTQTSIESPRYSYWPPFVFAAVWCASRALEYQPGRDHYVVPRRHKQFTLTWAEIIPYASRPISLPIGIVFGVLTTAGSLQARLRKSFPKVVWTSYFVLHSGAFGTVGPLRITNLDPRSADQWVPFTFAVAGAIWQYWREVQWLPTAIKERLANLFRWNNDGTLESEVTN
jgi:hypothetical protein